MVIYLMGLMVILMVVSMEYDGNNEWLVVWNIGIRFPFRWEFHFIPTDQLIFVRGVGIIPPAHLYRLVTYLIYQHIYLIYIYILVYVYHTHQPTFDGGYVGWYKYARTGVLPRNVRFGTHHS